MKNSITQQNAVMVLLERIPAFAVARSQDASFLSHDDNSPYLVFGDFGRFLADLIRNKVNEQEVDNTLMQAFSLLGEMATSSDKEVVNMAVVGVFEVLADIPEGIATARQQLSSEALDVFEKVAKGWV